MPALAMLLFTPLLGLVFVPSTQGEFKVRAELEGLPHLASYPIPVDSRVVDVEVLNRDIIQEKTPFHFPPRVIIDRTNHGTEVESLPLVSPDGVLLERFSEDPVDGLILGKLPSLEPAMGHLAQWELSAELAGEGFKPAQARLFLILSFHSDEDAQRANYYVEIYEDAPHWDRDEPTMDLMRRAPKMAQVVGFAEVSGAGLFAVSGRFLSPKRLELSTVPIAAELGEWVEKFQVLFRNIYPETKEGAEELIEKSLQSLETQTGLSLQTPLPEIQLQGTGRVGNFSVDLSIEVSQEMKLLEKLPKDAKLSFESKNNEGEEGSRQVSWHSLKLDSADFPERSPLVGIYVASNRHRQHWEFSCPSLQEQMWPLVGYETLESKAQRLVAPNYWEDQLNAIHSLSFSKKVGALIYSEWRLFGVMDPEALVDFNHYKWFENFAVTEDTRFQTQ